MFFVVILCLTKKVCFCFGTTWPFSGKYLVTAYCYAVSVFLHVVFIFFHNFVFFGQIIHLLLSFFRIFVTIVAYNYFVFSFCQVTSAQFFDASNYVFVFDQARVSRVQRKFINYFSVDCCRRQQQNLDLVVFILQWEETIYKRQRH